MVVLVDESVLTLSNGIFAFINDSLGESVRVLTSLHFYSGLVPGAYLISIS